MAPKKLPPKGLPLFAPTTALITTQVNHIKKTTSQMVHPLHIPQ
jgi:hypothetical protein